LTFSSEKHWKGDTKDDASDFGDHRRRSTRGTGRGRIYAPIARKKSAIQLQVGKKAPPTRVQEQKEKIVNYAVRFLFGKVPRPHSGAVFLGVIALGIFVSGCNKSQATTTTPVPEVGVTTVEQRDVPVYSEWVATLDGYVNAEIRPQVSGYIIKQDYTEGSLVRKGQVLFEIDPRPFTAALDRAKGDLAQAQAQLGKSTLDVERDTPLAEAKAIAKSLVTVAMFLVGFMLLVFFSIGLAHFLNSYFADTYIGFWAVAGIYGIIFLLLLLFRKSIYEYFEKQLAEMMKRKEK